MATTTVGFLSVPSSQSIPLESAASSNTTTRTCQGAERDNWVQQSQRGSHVKLRKERHPRKVIVPMHDRDLRPTTLRAILKDAGITEDRFADLLRS